MMSYASLNDTKKFLDSISSLVLVCDKSKDSRGNVILSYLCDGRSDTNFFVRTFTCSLGYTCVDIDGGGWMAPVVWNGPTADWDIGDDETRSQFIDYLMTHNPDLYNY
jgi:hypothetical protein